ncbi:MAG: ABC transporter permease, partial [bacterium]
MLGVIVRRLGIAVLLLLFVSFITFLFIALTPGSYFDQLRARPEHSDEYIDQLEEQYGLDDPVIVQYGRWLGNLLRGDLGDSLVHQQPVAPLLWDRFKNSVLLMGAAIFFTWLVALPLGIMGAVYQHKLLDKLFSVFAFVGMSIPNFFLAFLLLYVALEIGGWPLGGMTSVDFAEFSLWGKIVDIAQHMVIPVVVISTGALAGLQRITRGNMLEELRKQYVTSARARGLPENKIIYRHALYNAINPLITIFGFQFSTLVSGSALVEIICNWPGMGQLMLNAVRSQDQFLVVGVVLA